VTSAPAGFTVPAGGLGTLTAAARDDSHTVSWAFQVDDAAVQGLGANDTVTETFTVDVNDGNGSDPTKTVTVTIHGAEDAVHLDASTPAASVTEDVSPDANNKLGDSGSFGFTDADVTDVHTAGVTFGSVTSAPAGFTVPAGGLGTLTA